MTNDQRLWMNSHIADGLRALGLNITPETVAHELHQMDRLRATGERDYPPPDIYKKDLQTLRAAESTPASPGFFPIRLGAVIAYEVG